MLISLLPSKTPVSNQTCSGKTCPVAGHPDPPFSQSQQKNILARANYAHGPKFHPLPNKSVRVRTSGSRSLKRTLAVWDSRQTALIHSSSPTDRLESNSRQPVPANPSRALTRRVKGENAPSIGRNPAARHRPQAQHRARIPEYPNRAQESMKTRISKFAGRPANPAQKICYPNRPNQYIPSSPGITAAFVPKPVRSSRTSILPFPQPPFCGTLEHMGSKDRGRKETKKAPKPKPKPEPGRRREAFTPEPPK